MYESIYFSFDISQFPRPNHVQTMLFCVPPHLIYVSQLPGCHQMETMFFFSGARTHGFVTHSAFRISIGKVCKNFFVRVIPVRSRERAAKRDLPAKIGNRNEKTHGHNFRVRGPKTNSVLKKCVSKDAIRCGTSHSKIVALGFFITV